MDAFRFAAVIGMAALLGACVTAPDSGRSGSFMAAEEIAYDRVHTFANAAQIDAYLAAQDAEIAYIRERQEREGYEGDTIIVTGSRVADVAITNTQEEGVDEGGIVKATTDYLVILRRGRVYVVRHGDETLETVSSIDAFPPGDTEPDDTWYDEMLLHQGMVIIIGYSYGEDGTEISRFDLSDDGQLTYRDTHYLNSWDYYSSSNYASRLVGGTFYTYTPSSFAKDWRDDLPFLERRLADGSREKIGVTLEPGSIGISAAQLIDVAPTARMMHGISACDVLSEELACTTRTVLGTWSSEYYFSRDAAYVWTGAGHNPRWGRASQEWDGLVYRIPLDTDEKMTAMAVRGDPVDQFSFLDDKESENLFVLTVGDFVFEDSGNFGLKMWESEIAFGETALVRIPIEAMGNGGTQLPPSFYRGLPELRGHVENRYVGRHLMYGGGYCCYDDEEPELYIVPLEERWIERIEMPHGVSRLDRLGDDGVVIGEGEGDTLGFSAIEFRDRKAGGKLGATFMLPAAEEGENRSQAFYWRPDPGDPESGDGVMALPVNKELEGFNFYYLGSASGMFYLERKSGELSPVGELGTVPDEDALAAAEEMQKLEEEGDCKASCTDWYGNSRPIFIGDRIFALMGDQIIEGEIDNGVMREVRRLKFVR